jgi:hypothetical protein
MNYLELKNLQQESYKFLDSQPKYLQPFVTECIMKTENIIKAKEKFINEYQQFLKENK